MIICLMAVQDKHLHLYLVHYPLNNYTDQALNLCSHHLVLYALLYQLLLQHLTLQ